MNATHIITITVKIESNSLPKESSLVLLPSPSP